MAILPRTLAHTINRAMRTFPAVLVTGPRQSGKTTLLRSEHGATHRFITFEDYDVRERALADPRGFLERYPEPLILDEIQYVPQLLSYIKTRIDERREPGRWLLTGSQGFSLMEHVARALTGRVAVLTLLPFSVGEAFGRAGGDKSIGDLLAGIGRKTTRRKVKMTNRPRAADWILRGSYPEVRVNPDIDVRLWCAAYIQTYLERDIRQVVNVGDLNTFSRFLKLCAARTAQVLNMSDLARDTGVSVPTVKKWISALEASGQVFLLPPYHGNFGKRLIKAPKIYFLDTALCAYLLGLRTEEMVLDGPYLGSLTETVVVAEWLKAFLHRGEMPSLYYWRSRDGLEVDLLVEWDGKLHPFEVKATATVLPGHASSLIKWRELSGVDTPGIIVAAVAEPIPVTPGVMAVPWSTLGGE